MFCYPSLWPLLPPGGQGRSIPARSPGDSPLANKSTTKLRPIAEPFVVAHPCGARVRTRLRVCPGDEAVLVALGTHLGSLAGRDLAQRCREGRLDPGARSASRARRKRSATKDSSSRWAGTITRTSEDAWQTALRNLGATAASLRARIYAIQRRLRVPVAGRRGRVPGYASRREYFAKQRRLQILERRLAAVDARLVEGRVSVCRGGRRLAQARHHLEEAGLTKAGWDERWRAARLFICADGEAGKAWGNETIRWHPDEGSLEVKLPPSLAHLANRPHGRYRLSCRVSFTYRGDEVAAQATSGAVAYDISYDPARRRWYLDASWKLPQAPPVTLEHLRTRGVLAVDVNASHLAAVVVDSSGNPVGTPLTVSLDLAGQPSPTRDAHLRGAVSQLLALAAEAGCGAIAIEDLDFAEARCEGREHTGRRLSRGKRGRRFRALVAGIPTARFRDRLVQMAANRGLSVIAVDPAYTSRWGEEHWFGRLREASPEASGHHCAALVIGRRGLGQRARRRRGCASGSPEDDHERATDSAVRPLPDSVAGLPEDQPRDPSAPRARGRPHQRRKTQPADGNLLGDQVAEDRSWPPAGQQCSLLLSV
ncbi:MAG: transposase, OrfB family [Actinobacteria bacterium]|nr:transposase, OrfB family [Actinomycetota bacterium]MCW3042453.1 transposase, OrfB family [Actinomycetota bacterium]